MQLDIQKLTLDQKIGQLFMIAAVTEEEIAADCIAKKNYRMDKEYIEDMILYHYIGGIIYLGKSDKEKQINRTSHFQSISTIPLLIGQDLEPGRIGASRFPDNFNFPTNQELGKTNNVEQTKKIAHDIGNFCKEVGVHINFAPVVDINNNAANPVINDRSFSDKPQIVTAHASAFAQGLQDAGIIACIKHFPGHGDTTVDSHDDLPFIQHTKERLHAIELYPFKQLIKKNIPAIMIAHLCVPALEHEESVPATFSKTIVTDLLQNELGFSGLVITDALDMGAITKMYKPEEAALRALMAGNDILLCPVNVPAAVTAIKQALKDNVIAEDDINKHVEKILRIKQTIFKNME